MNLQELSDEELLKKYSELEQSKDLNENISQVLKILLNSYYGSTSMGHITYSNGNITASSITTAGRMSNKIASMYASNKVAGMLGEKPGTDLKYVPQVDTDSVSGDTIININNKDISIKDFFDNNGTLETKSKGNLIKHINNSNFTPSLNMKNGCIEYKKVNYIMAHKVKKRMFLIKLKDTEVKVTEDHSCIIERDGLYIDVKPLDILKSDKIIRI